MKRRNFIKSMGLVGAAAYIDPFSLIKPVQPFKVGDILEIKTLQEYGYDGGILAAYNQSHKGLRHIEEIDTGDDDHVAGYYEVVDLDEFKKSIIHYMDNGFQDSLKQLQSIADLDEEAALRYERRTGKKVNHANDDSGDFFDGDLSDVYWPLELEFYELCLSCIIIDDKKLWKSICKKYWPYKYEEIVTAWDDYQKLLLPFKKWDGLYSEKRDKYYHRTYDDSGIKKLHGFKIVKYTYSAPSHPGGPEYHWDDSYEVIHKSFPYNEVNKSNYQEYMKIKRLYW